MKRAHEIALRDSHESIIPAKRTFNNGIERTSELMAPIMMLEGHSGEIYTVKFHPDGKYLASSGYDRQIFVWNVFGECENIAVLSGHTNAVRELQFSTDGSHIFTCSADKTIGIWDFETGVRIKKLKGHTSIVNSCNSVRRGPLKICSGSDDGTIKMWDIRQRVPTHTFVNTYPVTAVTFNDTSDYIISAGIDNVLNMWDIRAEKLFMKLPGHTDTVTGISLSNDGSYILSNSMDNTLRVWDVRPYCPGERCIKLYSGHQHNFENNLLRCSWSPDGKRVSCGSADRYVYIWDTDTQKIKYKLPGHNGTVNEVGFHPTQSIVVSAASDKIIYLGELSI